MKRSKAGVGRRPEVRRASPGRVWAAGLIAALGAGVVVLVLLAPGSLSPIASLAAGDSATTRPAPASAPTTPGRGTTSAMTNPGTAVPTVTPIPKSTLPTSATVPTIPVPTTTVRTTTVPTTAPPTTAPPTTAAPATTAPPTTLSPTAAALAAKEPVLAVGDSVMLAATRALTATFGPEIRVDAAAGRPAAQAVSRLQEYRAVGELAHFRTVVIGLGTDSPLTPELFNDLVAELHGVPIIVFYDTYGSEKSEATTNATLAAGVPAHPGTIELNWTAVAPGPGLVASSSGKLTPAGATAFASLLDTALT